jgi:hypothetical protein
MLEMSTLVQVESNSIHPSVNHGRLDEAQD